jgi:hypothetical protein
MCTQAGQPFDLNGRFGVLTQLFVDVQAGGGIISKTGVESDFLLLADLTQQGQQVSLSVQVCALDLPPVPVSGQRPLQFVLDPALLRSVGTLTTTGSLSTAQSCAAITQPQPLAIVLGARLHSPLQDPLPTVDAQTGAYTACGGTLMSCQTAAPASAPCVCDQENDSKLGATLGVMNAPGFSDLDKIYVAFRAQVTLSGAVFGSDEIAGTVQAAIDQQVLGCHRTSGGANDCTPGELELIQRLAPTITQSDPGADNCNASLFTARRVPADTDCEALKAMRGTLF